MKTISLIFVFIFLSSSLLGLVDSLRQNLEQAPSEERAQILNQISRTLMKTDREQALQHAQLALQEAFKHGNDYEIADAIRLQGNYHFNGKSYAEALKLYQQALPYALKTKNIKLSGDIYNNIGHSHTQLGNLDMAEHNLMEALRYRNRLSSPDDEIVTTINLAQIYWLRQDYQKALQHYQSAAVLLRGIDNPKLAAANYNNMGNTLVKLGNNLGALEAFIKSLEIKTQLGSEAELAPATLNIGNLFYRINEYEKAEHYYLEALELYGKTGDADKVIIVEGNLGVLYNASGDYSKALEYHHSALTHYRNQGLEQDIAKTLNNIGNVYQNMKKYPEAIGYYNQARGIKLELNDLESLAVTEKNLGEVYLLSQDWEAALKYTLRSLEIANQLNKKLLKLYSYLQLSKIQAGMRDYQGAYESLQRFVELDQELHKETSLKALAEMVDRLDNRQRIKELTDLRRSSEQREADLRRLLRQRLHFILIVLIGSFFTITISVLFRQKQREVIKSKQLRADLEAMNSGLEERIAEEIEKYRQQQVLVNQKSKLESLGVLAAGIAHEINQPLSAISMSLDNMQNKQSQTKLEPEYLSRKYGSMQKDVDRIRKIIEHVRMFSRFQTDDDLEQVDINSTISEGLSIFEPVLKKSGISLNTRFSAGQPMALGNRFKLEQVLFNLLNNAIDTILERKEKTGDLADPCITVATECIDKQIIISVSDQGMGISEEAISKIFDPFYSTKNPDKGTGLGLAISYGIVADMDGKLCVSSLPGQGSTFEIRIPAIRT